MDADRRYRVEYREAEESLVLGTVEGVFPHFTALDPFLSRLRLAGVAAGELVLVDERTGRVRARRAVARITVGAAGAERAKAG